MSSYSYNWTMDLKAFVKSELSGWGKVERILFPLEILLIICISLYIGDNKIALISAVCGISYTILAGKGKISCFLFGLMGTFCYAYIAFKNQIYGNFLLYACYYFPMQTLGIFRWRKHLQKESGEIIKTTLSLRARFVYGILALSFSVLFYFILKLTGDSSPFMDSVTTVCSVGGLLLTVKRCLEQWYFWLVVNTLSVIIWVQAYMNGSNCLATVFMWGTYVILTFYFLYVWHRDLKAGKI